MKEITPLKNDGKDKAIQLTAWLWSPLPERHQEMLSGGAPRFNGGIKGS